MSNAQRPDDESRITTDRETIRGWADDHGAVPVRHAGAEGESDRLDVVPESELREEDERLDWDDFFHELDLSDQVVVYHGEGRHRTFEVLDRDEATARSADDSEAIEDALLEGETVTSEVTGLTVIERTVVEEVTIESEVVDREAVEEEIVDAELLTREVVGCELTESGEEGYVDVSQFQMGSRGEVDFDVEVEVQEGWSVTRELLERLTIRSRVVDDDVSVTDVVESDSVEAEIDVDGVQHGIVGGDLVDADAAPEEVVERGSVVSETGEDDAVETHVLERKTVEEEVTLRRRLDGEITEGETAASEAIRSAVIESEIVDWEDADVGVPSAGTGATAEEGAERAGESGTGATTDESGAETATDERDRATVSEDDEGKTVVDSDGEKIGMVVDVTDGGIEVDPHPSLADRIKSALGWGDLDEEGAYRVDADRIARVTDDRVELSIKE